MPLRLFYAPPRRQPMSPAGYAPRLFYTAYRAITHEAGQYLLREIRYIDITANASRYISLVIDE